MYIDVKVKLPELPNYIQIEARARECDTPAAVDIADLTDDQLRKIGEEWTGGLIAKAAERRRNQLKLQNVTIVPPGTLGQPFVKT